MEAILKDVVGASRFRSCGATSGGCISDGHSYDTDKGKFFIKMNNKSEARKMFDGEKESLDAILATGTVRCPKPWAVVDHPAGSGSVFVMEHLDIHGLGEHSAALGDQLGRLHLHNSKLKLKQAKEENRAGIAGDEDEGDKSQHYASQFGFHTTTCCGYLPQDNAWCDDWVMFYAQQRLKLQLDLVEREYGDREARELWTRLERKLPQLFQDLDITPALLHGDLWSGNVGQMDTCPVIFDPASFYGHHEFDLGIAGMFGGFSRDFYNAYHKMVPKAQGFEERHKLYKLFHYLNHWNHFGTGYRGSSLSVMRDLVRD